LPDPLEPLRTKNTLQFSRQESCAAPGTSVR
jgi:hypothetical protein